MTSNQRKSIAKWSIYLFTVVLYYFFNSPFTSAFELWPHHIRLVDPSRETLEDGLSRELMEELGVRLPVSEEDHFSSCYAPPLPPFSSSSPPLITHFYVKKIEEEQVKEVERAAASTAADHGLEVISVGPFHCQWLPLSVCLPIPFFSRFSGWSESRYTP